MAAASSGVGTGRGAALTADMMAGCGRAEVGQWGAGEVRIGMAIFKMGWARVRISWAQVASEARILCC